MAFIITTATGVKVSEKTYASYRHAQQAVDKSRWTWYTRTPIVQIRLNTGKPIASFTMINGKLIERLIEGVSRGVSPKV